MAAVGSREWELAGGPPLSFGDRLGLLFSAGRVLIGDVFARARDPQKIDLAAWAPPDTPAVRAADGLVRAVSSAAMVDHSFRTYWFSAIECELAGATGELDREALYVAAMLHDVGLFDVPREPGDHCFTVASARAARKIVREAGWAQDREDAVAAAITTNLNPIVPRERYGAEAYFMNAGGSVEVLAKEWRVHPDNLQEILQRHPRAGFAADALSHVAREVARNPRGRFACLDPIFPFMVKRSRFSRE